MDLCISVFVYVGSIVLYKRIVNANTQNIRIANADDKGLKLFACVFIRTPSPFLSLTLRLALL